MTMPPPECHPDRRYFGRGMCQPCYLRDWYKRNPGKHGTYAKRHRERHPDAAHAYYEANKERISERDKARRRANPEINKRRVAAKYGLTVAERDALLTQPCGICGNEATDIDHDHATGRVRGPLCGPCNSGIGSLRDDPELCEQAASYLRRHARLAA